MEETKYSAEDRKWSQQLRYITLVTMMILGVLAVRLVQDNLTLFFISLSISFLLMPFIGFFQKRLHFPRSLAVLTSYILGLAILVVLMTLILPVLIERVTDFATQYLPTIFENVDKWLADTIRQLEVNSLKIGSETIDLSVPLVEARRWLNSLEASKIDLTQILNEWSTILSSAFSIGRNVFSTILSFVTALMISIHVANDGDKLQGKLVGFFKKQYQPEIRELLTRLSHVWTKFFVGELKLMLIIGVMTAVFCSAVGLKGAILLGVLAGALEIIPNIGPILSAIPAILSAVVFGSSYLPFGSWVVALITVLGYILIQQLENVIVVPRIMSEAVGIHPVLLIIGILVLSGKLGVLGALLAAPLLGMVKVAMEYALAKLREEDPYPELYR